MKKNSFAPNPEPFEMTELPQIARSQSGLGGKLGSSFAENLGNAVDNAHMASQSTTAQKGKKVDIVTKETTTTKDTIETNDYLGGYSIKQEKRARKDGE